MYLTDYFLQGVAFVVPDEAITIAYSALLESGFPPCTLGTGCAHSAVRQRPASTTHLHITDERVVSLHRKSQTLLTFPNFDEIPRDVEKPYTMHASDPQIPSACVGRGAGRFSPSLYPVQIPTAVRYCEAVISLLCRDRGGAFESYWIVLLTYMMEFVDGTSIFNEEALAQPYRRFYHAVKCGDRNMYLILDEVRRDLMGTAAGK